MGVDFYTCSNCHQTYPDCGPTARCQHHHQLGPCCFPKVNGKWVDSWPDDQLTEDDDGEEGAVMEAHCPTCAKGGTDAQKLAKVRGALLALMDLKDDRGEIHKFLTVVQQQVNSQKKALELKALHALIETGDK